MQPTTANDVIKQDIDNVLDNCQDEISLLKNKQVLLTGGGGFLGYLLLHVFEKIINNYSNDSPKVTIVDNFKRGKPSWLDRITLNNNVSLIEHDIAKTLPSDIYRFDYIIHAASIASPTYYRRYPLETIDVNVNGIRNLLEYSKKRTLNNDPILGLLFFSTSEIYGDPDPENIPTEETYRGLVSCTGPRACYDESKRLGETLCVNFVREFEIPVTIVRPFNNYGPGLNINDKRIIPDLANNIFNNKDLELFSDGKATRTFCYVSDAISGYIKALLKGEKGESYNIGSEKPEISINDLSKLFRDTAREIFNYNGKIIYKKNNDKAYLDDNPNRRCPNINKAKTELGYHPLVEIDEGIRRSLIWYSENY